MIKNTKIRRILISLLTCIAITVSLTGCAAGGGSSGSASGSGIKVFFTTPVLDDFKELLMNAGAWIFGVRLSEFGNETVPYYATHIVSAGIVLIWNYIGRKIFVFKKEKQE